MPMAHYEKKANGRTWPVEVLSEPLPRRPCHNCCCPLSEVSLGSGIFASIHKNHRYVGCWCRLGIKRKEPLAPLNSSASPGGVVQTDDSGAEPQVNHEP
jgi:hypothetical protein